MSRNQFVCIKDYEYETSGWFTNAIKNKLYPLI